MTMYAITCEVRDKVDFRKLGQQIRKSPRGAGF